MATTTLFSQNPVLFNVAAATSVFPLGYGLNALLRPRSGLGVFQFPVPATADQRKLVDNLMRIYGARNAAIGVIMLAAYAYEAKEVLAVVLLGSSFMALVDGWISLDQIGKNAWFHWGYVPVLVGFAVGLLGLDDGML